MARPLRIEFEGAIYHVCARGNARQTIFLDDLDHQEFLKRLAQNIAHYEVRLYLFCLMGNHFHLVVETPRANLGRFMQSLQTGYAVYFNRRHDRPGHLTQGRYHARLVEEDLYLLSLSRYVHLNPVYVGKVRELPLRERIRFLRAYPWSSYPSYVGQAKALEFVDYGPLLAHVAGQAGGRVSPGAAYRQFVERGLVETDKDLAEVLKASPHGIGGEAFCRRLEGLRANLLGRRTRREDVALRKAAVDLTPDQVLEAVCEAFRVSGEDLRQRTRGSLVRPVAAHLLCKYAGLTQRQAAATLALGTGAAVSMQLKSLRQSLARDARLRDTLAKADSRLQAALRSAESL